MKTLIFIFAFLCCFGASCQDKRFVMQIDSIVLAFDMDNGESEEFRWLLGFIKYKTTANSLTKIIHSYKAGSRQIIQTFYIKDSMLIFVRKEATSYYFYGDSTVLLGKYYFDKNILKYCDVCREEDLDDVKQIENRILAKYKKTQETIFRHHKKKGRRQTWGLAL